MKGRCHNESLHYCATCWGTLASSYTPDKRLVESLWEEMEDAYCGPGRYYHTLNHISYMLQKLEDYRKLVTDRDSLQFSVFYHDIIYNTGRTDNEARSAAKAAASLHKLGVPAATIEKCTQQIIATKAHTAAPDTDTNLLTDIDLAILGEPWPLYHAYTQQIRKEYAIYPDFMYKRGRRKVLEHFLSMSRIYKTEELQAKFEEQARRNLTQELMLL